jgi:UDP-glucose 4-epimerase
MIPTLIQSLLQRQRPALTPGTQLWDYLYVEDVARAIARVALDPAATGIFNLGSGSPQTVRSIAEQVRDAIDPHLPLGFGDVPFRPDQVMHLQADTRRLSQTTGWTPQVQLGEGLQRTIEWFRAQRSTAQ